MTDETALTVLEQRDVVFYDDELTAIRAGDGNVYVAIRQMCNALGIDDRSQRRRIQRHTVLNEGFQRGVILTPHRGEQEMTVLRVDLVPLWLSGIRTSMVSENVRPKLERFQREAARVLWEAFQTGRLTFHDEIMQADSPSAQAYQIAMALADLARQQYIMEKRVDARLNTHERRIELLESALGSDERFVSEAEATDISQGVKAIAHELGKRSGRNEYGGVYGELYRRFQITSYRRLPAAKYDEAMSWLRQWYATLTDAADVPF